jgi:hypothetical protein
MLNNHRWPYWKETSMTFLKPRGDLLFAAIMGGTMLSASLLFSPPAQADDSYVLVESGKLTIATTAEMPGCSES